MVCASYYAPDGLIYGFRSDFKTEPTYELLAVSVDPYVRKVIAQPTSFWSAMAMTDDGMIYALDNVGVLWKCTRSGEITKIGETGISCELPTYYGAGGSAMIEKGGNTMIVNVYGINNDLPGADTDYSGSLYRVNLSTGAATLIVHFTYNDNIKALRYPKGAIAGIPATMQPITLDFNGGSLTGNVGFTLPSAATDGSVPDGNLTWKVYVNGTVAATGTGAWGSAVSAPVTATRGGLNYFYAECASATGPGVGSGEWKFVGSDVPVTPSNVNAKFFAGGSMVMITWDKVTTSVNGGYIDPDEVTYTLRRYSGPEDTEGEIWKENIKITSEARPMSEPERMTDFRWGVTASYDGKTSAEGFSNSLRSGSVVPAWSYDFQDENDIFTLFSTVNNNSDYSASSQWKYAYSGYGANKNGMVQVQINTAQAPGEDWDKWLISPNMKLIPGKVYEFSIDSKAYRASTTAPQKFEVKLGTSSNDMETMTTTIIPVSDVSKTSFQTYKGYLSVNKEDKYYIGVHVCTPCEPTSTRNLYFDNFSIGLPQETSAPGQVSELNVVPDPTGLHKVEISFKAPTLDFAGENPLQSLDRVEIARNDTVIHTFNHPGFGELLNYTDNDVPLGSHTYEVTGYNENGKGNPMSETVYAGVKLPGVPTGVTAVRMEDYNKVKLTWNPVIEDADGAALPEGGIKSYSVIELIGGQQKWLQDVEGNVTELVIDALEEGLDQDFKMYAVFAETESGLGRGRASDPVLVGKPDKLPFNESFDEGKYHHNYMITGNGGGNWYLCDNSSIGLQDADGNNGFAIMKADYADDSKGLLTGRIDLTESLAPRIAFQTFNIVAETVTSDLNELEVYVVDEEENETLLKKIVMNEDCSAAGWNRFVCDLKEFAGKNIQIRFQATCRNLQYTMLDGVSVYEAHQHDLRAVSISAPDKIRPNDEFKVRVRIENNGANTETNYNVLLYRNGESEFSAKGRTLHPNETIWVDVPASVSVFEEGWQEFMAEVELDDDGNLSDNMTESVKSRLIYPKLPVVTDGIAQCDESGNVEVKWNAPYIERTPAEVTDDMEAYEGRSDYCDEWLFVDGDDAEILGFEGFVMPGAPYGSKRSWFVLDNTDSGFAGQNSFYANSGNKCLVQMGVTGEAQDWIISPVLSGNAQTVSFWLRCYYPGSKETLEFLSSSRSQSTWDFTRMAAYDIYNHNWTKYMVNVPEGTKYFALKATTSNGIMVMVDDITYTPLGNSQVKLLGYNIYRDKEKLNQELMAIPSFAEHLDSDPVGQKYHVTAVYEEGESLPVAIDTQSGLGVSGVYGNDIRVSGSTDSVIISGAAGEPVSIASADGKIVWSSDKLLSDNETVAVGAAGVYIVRVGNRSFKILVK